MALEGVKWGLRGEWDCNYITSWRLFDPFEGSRGCQLFLGMAPWLIGHILMGLLVSLMGGFGLAGHVLGINNNHVIASMVLFPFNNEKC